MNVRRSAVSLFATAVLLAPLGLAGCGRDEAGGHPAADVNAAATDDPAVESTQATSATDTPCPLEAAALSSVISIEMTRTPSARCGFVAASPKPGQVIEVYYTPIDAMIYEGSEGEQVPGVADGARWDTQMSGSLLVKSGSKYFSVQALAMGDLPENLRAKNLATAVAGMILAGPNR